MHTTCRTINIFCSLSTVDSLSQTVSPSDSLWTQEKSLSADAAHYRSSGATQCACLFQQPTDLIYRHQVAFKEGQKLLPNHSSPFQYPWILVHLGLDTLYRYFKHLLNINDFTNSSEIWHTDQVLCHKRCQMCLTGFKSSFYRTHTLQTVFDLIAVYTRSPAPLIPKCVMHHLVYRPWIESRACTTPHQRYLFKTIHLLFRPSFEYSAAIPAPWSPYETQKWYHLGHAVQKYMHGCVILDYRLWIKNWLQL